MKRQSHGKVSVVVGSPGNKGIDRRRIWWALSEEANVAYLTMDDPAFEDPMKIASEIDAHINHDNVKVIFEMTRKGIKDAILNSSPEDISVILVKGKILIKINGVDTPYPTTQKLFAIC